tara:strand:+ start:867 stop:1208 length:342 start_codon:yes stop_codon:yes gene_type:complete
MDHTRKIPYIQGSYPQATHFSVDNFKKVVDNFGTDREPWAVVIGSDNILRTGNVIRYNEFFPERSRTMKKPSKAKVSPKKFLKSYQSWAKNKKAAKRAVGAYKKGGPITKSKA